MKKKKKRGPGVTTDSHHGTLSPPLEKSESSGDIPGTQRILNLCRQTAFQAKYKKACLLLHASSSPATNEIVSFSAKDSLSSCLKT